MSSIGASITNLPFQIFQYLSDIFSQILATLNLTNKTGTLLILGLDNAGKTTLLHRLRTNSILSFPPTERPTLETFSMGGVKFVGWDVGGHEAVRHLWEDYIWEVGAVVFVLDAVDGRRLEEVRDELDNLITLLLTSQDKEEEDFKMYENIEEGNKKGVIPFAILLNKCDLNDALESREVAQAIEYDEIASRYGENNVGMFRISVWRGEGYQEAFRWISEFL